MFYARAMRACGPRGFYAIWGHHGRHGFSKIRYIKQNGD